MKSHFNSFENISIRTTVHLATRLLLFVFLLSCPLTMMAQEEEVEKKEHKKVRPTFESVWLIDNQSVTTNSKGTLEMDILHRFGPFNNGYEDLYGLFAPSNIRIGFSYSILDNLMLGFGITKTNFLWDLNLKYAIITQTRDNFIPLSITYYGNVGIDSRDENNFDNSSDRISYFNQVILARRFNRKFSVQISPTLSHFNSVPGYKDANDEIIAQLNNTHFAMSISGRYMIGTTAIIAGYDQPITKHHKNNPHPNLSLGIEMNTSAHAFQLFVSNYYNIVPQRNNMFNNYDYIDVDFLIGFNITRLWNF